MSGLMKLKNLITILGLVLVVVSVATPLAGCQSIPAPPVSAIQIFRVPPGFVGMPNTGIWVQTRPGDSTCPFPADIQMTFAPGCT